MALLKGPKSIVITTHSNPDADALGSSLGLKHFLDRAGHQVTVITPTDYPEFLKWMPGNKCVEVYDSEKPKMSEETINQADIVFCLDFSDLKRIDGLGEMVANTHAEKITVDHHQHPKEIGRYMVHSTEAAATAELVFDMIVAMESEEAITREIASCLYAGLMTDTGSFRHSNTNSKVLHTAAVLAERGAEPSLVAKLVYDTNSPNRLRFLGYALWELMKLDMNKGVGYFVISSKDAERFNLQSGDTEGLVNYALSVKGIKVAALFREKDEIVKISFRSVGEIEVNKFASENFDGGGHRNAAGGRSEASLDETVLKFQNLMESGKLI